MKKEAALHEIRRMLRNGRFLPNTKLPPERQLAAELGISRTYLRYALDELEAEGKIWRHVGQGTFVGSRPVRSSTDITILETVASPSDVMEVRLLIEPEAARLAALRATSGDIEYLERCLRKAEEAADFTSYARWDAALHRGITEAAANKLLFLLFDAVNTVRNQKSWVQLWSSAMNVSRQRKYDDHHRRIVRAIAARDSLKAQDEMRKHLEAVQKNLVYQDR